MRISSPGCGAPKIIADRIGDQIVVETHRIHGFVPRAFMPQPCERHAAGVLCTPIARVHRRTSDAERRKLLSKGSDRAPVNSLSAAPEAADLFERHSLERFKRYFFDRERIAEIRPPGQRRSRGTRRRDKAP